MSTTLDDRQPTTLIPVTTMEEVPVLAEAEKAELLASLQKARDEIAAGDCTEHDSGNFVEHLMAIRAQALRS